MQSNMSKCLKGEYIFFRNGVEVFRSPNIVTNQGKIVIAEYLSGQSSSYASSIVVGAGSSVALASNEHLDFEMGSVPISFKTVDATQDPVQVVFRGTISSEFIGKIYESGLIVGSSSSLAGFSDVDSNPEILATFNPDFEDWDLSDNMVSFYSNISGSPSGIARIGSYGLRFNLTASSTSTSSLILTETPRYYSPDAKIQFAFNCTTVPASILIKLLRDESNYLSQTISTGISAGYNIISIPISGMTVEGDVETSEVEKVEISITSGASSSIVILDGIRFYEPDILSESTLVSRSVLSTPIEVDGGYPFDIEYRVGFDI